MARYNHKIFGLRAPESGGKDLYLVVASLKAAWPGYRMVVRLESSRADTGKAR